MTVAELIGLLCKQPQDMPVKIEVGYGDSINVRCEVRDIFNRDRPIKFEKSVLQIGEYINVGMPHMTPELLEIEIQEFCQRLNSAPFSSGRFRYMQNGTDQILYTGTDTDSWKYGKKYDPRAIDEAVKRGWVFFDSPDGQILPPYPYLTELGKTHLKSNRTMIAGDLSPEAEFILRCFNGSL